VNGRFGRRRDRLGVRPALTLNDGGNWLEERDTHYDELRQETRTEFAAVRHEIGALREEMRSGFAAVDAKMTQGFAAMDVKFAQRNAELMKWALGFWIASLLGVVGALAALTRLPR
jgi:hypothetical protein